MKRTFFFVGVALTMASGNLLVPSARANVFASDIRINGGFSNATVAAGGSVQISYILNEPASRGVTVDILAGSTVIRSFSLTTNNPGTTRGLNSIIWDLRDSASNFVPGGSYGVRVTAASAGYPEWTQVSFDSEENTFIYDGRGIASVQDASNPYFGRLLAANSDPGFPETDPGKAVGILKLNADGSTPEDGFASNGGRDWPGSQLGPWKVETFGSFVYANDLSVNGEVFRWDPTISSNSLTPVMRADNRPVGASFGGFDLAIQGTNTSLWMADRTTTLGVVKWNLAADGTCANADTGVTIVGIGSDPSGLSLPPQDVAIDPAGNIYVCQSVPNQGNPAQRVFRFHPYDPATNGGVPLLTADWAVGGGDDTYGGASGIAVDPTGTYVAVAFQGVTLSSALNSGGNTKILFATNGALVTNLDLGLVIQGDPTHQDTDCAWDAAGNVYYIDNWWGRWRAVSPPGANQTTSLAPANIIVSGTATAPEVTGISVSNNVVLLTFRAAPGDSPNDFVVLASGSPSGPFVAQNASITIESPGVFTAALAASGSTQFYRVDRKSSPTQEPNIQTISVTAGVVTISFTAATSDSASAFTLLSTSSLSSNFVPVSNAQFGGSGGNFYVTAPAEGPMRFYRIQR